jgi:hypothetical protein
MIASAAVYPSEGTVAVPPDIRQSDPGRLAEIMDLDPSPQRLWDESEYGAIYEHQLDVALDIPASTDPANESAAPGRSPTTAASATPTIGRALFQDGSIPQLLSIKEFAKANASRADSGLPRDVAEALYYLSIAAGMVRHGRRMTTLPGTDLRRGLEWAAGRTWLNDAGRQLLHKMLQTIAATAQNEQ